MKTNSLRPPKLGWVSLCAICLAPPAWLQNEVLIGNETLQRINTDVASQYKALALYKPLYLLKKKLFKKRLTILIPPHVKRCKTISNRATTFVGVRKRETIALHAGSELPSHLGPMMRPQLMVVHLNQSTQACPSHTWPSLPWLRTSSSLLPISFVSLVHFIWYPVFFVNVHNRHLTLAINLGQLINVLWLTGPDSHISNKVYNPTSDKRSMPKH